MNIDPKQIINEVDAIIPKIEKIRQHIHAQPELSLNEQETSAYIRQQLEPLDLEIFPPFLSTDVIALLNPEKTEKNVTLRADIDALPIQEQNDLPYSSKMNNVMHACGHDGHTAMLIGAAIILEQVKDQLNGSVRFVFQPGEEIVAAGRDLVEKGILNSPKPAAVLAVHSWPGYPLGSICSKPGAMMAAADIFKITIKGKGGHGSAPEQSNDPIFTATKIINNLYLLPSRKFRALDNIVLSVCKIQAGDSSNVIPDEAIMEGTVRYFSREVGKKIPSLFEKVIRDECESSGTTYTLDYNQPYIATINDPDIVSLCKKNWQDISGDKKWIDLSDPVMASEDFSYYLDTHPGGMFFLGMGENSSKLHTNSFNFNDEAIRNGIFFHVTSTLALLNR